jgi:hypothetical protein
MKERKEEGRKEGRKEKRGSKAEKDVETSTYDNDRMTIRDQVRRGIGKRER